ncbi:MAG: hypothetical protein MI976_26035 [Pseudomonadales bacterium]|nr:hypothetical protein [Pseudomonadales bacterium]
MFGPSHSKYLKLLEIAFFVILVASVILVYPGIDVSGLFLYELLHAFYGVYFTGLDSYKVNRAFDQSVTGLFLFVYLWLPITLYIGLRLVWERRKFKYTDDQVRKISNWKVKLFGLLFLGLFYWGFGESEGKPNICNTNCSNLNEFFFMFIFPGAWIAIWIILMALICAFSIKWLVGKSTDS